MISKQEMLSAIETLFKFQNILLGSEIMIYNDYMNNVNLLIKYASKYIQYQYQLMEEFGPKFIYLNGPANNLANTLSQLKTGKDVSDALCVLDTNKVVISMYDDAS